MEGGADFAGFGYVLEWLVGEPTVILDRFRTALAFGVPRYLHVFGFSQHRPRATRLYSQ